MDPTQLIAALKSQITQIKSRSDVLVPLLLIICVFTLGLLILVAERAPPWLVISLFCLVAGLTVIFGFAYLYSLFKNPDLLRSEKHSLTKQAIDRGLLGDSMQGLFDAEPSGSVIEGTATHSEAEE
jgi:hypothetical protein